MLTILAYLVPVIIYSPPKLRIISLAHITLDVENHNFIKNPNIQMKTILKLLWPILLLKLWIYLTRCLPLFPPLSLWFTQEVSFFFKNALCVSCVQCLMCVRKHLDIITCSRSQANSMMMHLMVISVFFISIGFHLSFLSSAHSTPNTMAVCLHWLWSLWKI